MWNGGELYYPVRPIEPNRRKSRTDYVVPMKIDGIVSSRREELEQRISSDSEGCPLLGYILERESEEYISPELLERGSINHPDLMGMDRRVEIHVKGCSALRDPVCYEVDGTRRRQRKREPAVPKVACKEDCPVYRRVKELLNGE
ncbi:MAG: hypothetical protein WCV90_06710 [Candidatus Woesearchaeota archaeon]|jgi:hypothetical protein